MGLSLTTHFLTYSLLILYAFWYSLRKSDLTLIKMIQIVMYPDQDGLFIAEIRLSCEVDNKY